MNEDIILLSQIFFDFKLSSYEVRKTHLQDYEIELIMERYNVSKEKVVDLFTKVYTKKITMVNLKKTMKVGLINEY